MLHADAARPRKRSGGRKKILGAVVAYSFVAPNFLGFAIFTLVPLVSAFVLGFTQWDGAHPIEFVGFANFARLLGDGKFWRSFLNTALYTTGVVPLTMACALALAVLLNQRVKGRDFFRTVSFFPYVASLVAVSAVWNFLFSPDRGPVNNLLHALTGLPFKGDLALPRWAADRNPLIVMFTVVFFTVWKNMGYYMVIYLAGLQGINPELYEAADIDGAGSRDKFWRVTLPQLAPTTFFVLMILIINSFKVYDIFINIFAGGDNQLSDNSRVLVYQIYNTAFRELNYGYASAMAMVLFLIVLCITLAQFKIEKRFSA